MFEKLDQIKPALKDLVKELRKKYAYASVLAVEDDNRGWRISRTGKRINSQGFGGGSGYVVRVFDQIGCAEWDVRSVRRRSTDLCAISLPPRCSDK